MAVWLGQAGGLRLQRQATSRFFVPFAPSDVDVAAKRFGFDRSGYLLTTGDSVWFRRVDAAGMPSADSLDFIAPSGWADNARHPDGRWFVHVDGMGGTRLYREWSDALAGRVADAVELTVPSAAYRLSLEIREGDNNCLAQTIGWELNTNRDVADISSLGDGFRQQMGTLVSGSGSVDCLFDISRWACDETYEEGNRPEPAVYLHRLVLRQEIGSAFTGIFLLKQENALPLDAILSPSAQSRELFYRCNCIITEVGVALNPLEAIHSRIEFVTTGPMELLYEYPSSYLLQEQPPSDKILQETGFGILLETPAD